MSFEQEFSGAMRWTSTVSPFLSGDTILEAMHFARKGTGFCPRDSSTSPWLALRSHKHRRLRRYGFDLRGWSPYWALPLLQLGGGKTLFPGHFGSRFWLADQSGPILE